MAGQKPDLEAKLLEAQQHLSDVATKFTQLFSLMGVAKDPEHRKMLEKSAASLQQSMDVWGARVAELGKATIQEIDPLQPGARPVPADSDELPPLSPYLAASPSTQERLKAEKRRAEQVGEFRWVLEAKAIQHQQHFPMHNGAVSDESSGVRHFHKDDVVFMLSHRWETAEDPDPTHAQARRLGNFISAALEAAKVRQRQHSTLLLHAKDWLPSSWSTWLEDQCAQWEQLSGVEACHRAKKFIGQHLWLRTNDFACQHPFWRMVKHIEQNMRLGQDPLDHVAFWVDWSCLPQKHREVPQVLRGRPTLVRASSLYRRSRAERTRFAMGMDWAASSLLDWPTVAIVSDDFPSRGWCVVEVVLARAGLFGVCCIPPNAGDSITFDQLKKSMYLHHTAHGVHPHTLINQWDGVLECTNGYDKQLLANRSYSLFHPELTNAGRLLYRMWQRSRQSYYLLPAPLLYAFGMRNLLAFAVVLMFLLVLGHLSGRRSYRWPWTPNSIISRLRHLRKVEVQRWVMQACVSATTSALLSCKSCAKGCPRCMGSLATSLPPLKADHTASRKRPLKRVTSSTALAIVCMAVGVWLRTGCGLAADSPLVVALLGVVPTGLLGFVLHLTWRNFSHMQRTPQVDSIMELGQRQFDEGKYEAAKQTFVNALRVAAGLAQWRSDGWGQDAVSGDAAKLLEAADTYVASCKCGVAQSAEGTHYLSNALINAGFTELDQGDGDNHRLSNGFCVCPAGRPIRARELHEWFIRHGRLISPDMMKPSKRYAVYQENDDWKHSGHVLIKWVDGFAGTDERPHWPVQRVYEFMQ